MVPMVGILGLGLCIFFSFLCSKKGEAAFGKKAGEYKWCVTMFTCTHTQIDSGLLNTCFSEPEIIYLSGATTDLKYPLRLAFGTAFFKIGLEVQKSRLSCLQFICHILNYNFLFIFTPLALLYTLHTFVTHSNSTTTL